MSEHLRRARRMLAVQAQLERLAQWELIELKSLVSALEDRRSSLLQFVQGQSAFTGVFGAMAMRRLQKIAEELAKATAGMQAQTARHLELHRRLLRSEHLAAALTCDAQRQKAAQELAEAIELAALRQRKPAARVRGYPPRHDT